MRRAFIPALCVLCLLSGCARYQALRACRAELGPEPDSGLVLLGGLGAAIQESDSSWQSWNARRNACVETRMGSEQAEE